MINELQFATTGFRGGNSEKTVRSNVVSTPIYELRLERSEKGKIQLVHTQVKEKPNDKVGAVCLYIQIHTYVRVRVYRGKRGRDEDEKKKQKKLGLTRVC